MHTLTLKTSKTSAALFSILEVCEGFSSGVGSQSIILPSWEHSFAHIEGHTQVRAQTVQHTRLSGVTAISRASCSSCASTFFHFLGVSLFVRGDCSFFLRCAKKIENPTASIHLPTIPDGIIKQTTYAYGPPSSWILIRSLQQQYTQFRNPTVLFSTDTLKEEEIHFQIPVYLPVTVVLGMTAYRTVETPHKS